MCRCGRVVFMKFTVCFTSKFNTQFPLIEIIGKNTTNRAQRSSPVSFHIHLGGEKQCGTSVLSKPMKQGNRTEETVAIIVDL